MKLDIRPVNKELRKALDSIALYDRQSFKRIEKAVEDGTKAIERGARRRVPIRSGSLKKSIFSRMDRKDVAGYVGAKAPHAHLVEHGVKEKTVDLKDPGTLSMRRKRKGVTVMPLKGAKPSTKPGARNTGFATKFTIPARAKRPFMSPAFEEERPKIVRSFEQAVQPGRAKS